MAARKQVPSELGADWQAIKKKLPKEAKRRSREYPEMAEDWATLKNLPKHAYRLEWDYGGKLALQQVKVVDRRERHGTPGFVVALDRTLYKEKGWRRTVEHTRVRPEWVARVLLCFTNREVETSFYHQRQRQLDIAYDDIKRTRLKLVGILEEYQWVEDLLLRVRGDNAFLDVMAQVPKRRVR
jgi:hypothetical protein